MRRVRVVNERTGAELGARIGVADRWWLRMRGMLLRPPPAPGEGLWIEPCPAVHMYGMRFPLDVAFLDRRGVVVALYPELRPGQRSRVHRDARGALELPAGTLHALDVRPGDTLTRAAAA